ncbi:MAG: hypothetical protein SWI22_01030 [Pseudomonadota bacterium]|nr:hypothetical protein [Pseudomonadota bacterium]
MPSASDAYPEPPRVVLFKGDIILSGPGCNAAYTIDATRALRAALDEILRRADAD